MYLKKRKMFWIPGVAIVVAVLVLVFGRVDDWRRDFRENHAKTSDDAVDERLRPIRTSLGQEELSAVVRQAANNLRGWAHVSEAEDETGGTTIHFVRITPLMRFKDDIHVTITATPEGSLLTAESRSRVGRGDLGQNPRNLKELLGAVREQLRTRPDAPR